MKEGRKEEYEEKDNRVIKLGISAVAEGRKVKRCKNGGKNKRIKKRKEERKAGKTEKRKK